MPQRLVQAGCTKVGEVDSMKRVNLDNLYVLVAAFIVNKFLLFGLISATNRALTMGFFVLVVLNFLVLAKAVDKLMKNYERLKKENNLRVDTNY